MPAFKPHPLGEPRRRSLTAIIGLLLSNKDAPEILEKHVRDLLDTALWKYTEADGKYSTRYQSSGALQCRDKTQLRHEHVYPRSKLIDALIATPNRLDEILLNAIGCIVTIDEHRTLSTFDDKQDGWERYRQAKVTVIDTNTGEELSIDNLPKLPTRQ